MNRTLREGLLIVAGLIAVVGFALFLASAPALGLLPFWWAGVAAGAVAGAAALYVGFESHALHGDGEDDDDA